MVRAGKIERATSRLTLALTGQAKLVLKDEIISACEVVLNEGE